MPGKKIAYGRNDREYNTKEINMARKRHQIKSECPECGCGLIDNMTPDEYREKHGKTKDEASVKPGKNDKSHDGRAPEKHTAAQINTES